MNRKAIMGRGVNPIQKTMESRESKDTNGAEELQVQDPRYGYAVLIILFLTGVLGFMLFHITGKYLSSIERNIYDSDEILVYLVMGITWAIGIFTIRLVFVMAKRRGSKIFKYV